MGIPAFAVVGMGGYAKTHLNYVRQVEEEGLGKHVAEVALPSDQEVYVDEVEALRARGVEIYPSLREMLAVARDRIDVVCIPTGIPLHRPMAVAALEAGVNVLVEKPAAGSIQDVDAMIRARDEAGKLCTVGFQHLYRPDLHLLKEWICEGRLGRLRRVKSFGCWPRDRAYYRRNAWAGHLAVGDAWVLDGPHNNALGHAVNVMCYVGCDRPGESVTPTSIQAELYRANEIESADTVVFRAETQEGVEIFFAVSHCTDRTLNPTIVLEGERGRIEWGYRGGMTVLWNDGSRETYERTEEPPRIFEDIAEVLLGRKASLFCPIDVTRAQTLCVCGTFESSPIHEFPPDVRVEEPEKDAVVIRDMTELILEAFERAALFSEFGVPWAKPGERVSLERYRYFPTFRRCVGE